MQVPALKQKHIQSPPIVILKAVCRFVFLHLSTFPVSPFFPRVLLLPLPLATLLVIVSSSLTLRRAIEIKKQNVSPMGYFSREIMTHRL